MDGYKNISENKEDCRDNLVTNIKNNKQKYLWQSHLYIEIAINIASNRYTVENI